MLRLIITALVSTVTNERKFSKFKIVEIYLSSTTTVKSLKKLTMLNFNKDILDDFDMEILVEKWIL